MRRIHLPALGSLLATLAGLATAIVAVPALTATGLGKVAAGVVCVSSVVQSMTKPLPK